MTPQEAVIRLREWYQAFKNFGKGDEPTVQEFLEAADLIESLTAELEEAKLTHRTEKCEAADYDCVELGRLRKELAQVKRERDDVARWEDDCPHCQHRDDAPVDCDLECLRCENPCICHKCRDGDKFEWRGVQKEDGNA